MCVRFCVCVAETRSQAEGARGGTENGFSKGWRFGGVKGRAGQGCVRSAAETAADAQNRAYLRSYCGSLWRYSGYLRIPARLFIELRGRRVRGAQRPGPNSPKLSCARLARCIAARGARTCTTPCVRACASLCAWLRPCHISLRARARVCTIAFTSYTHHPCRCGQGQAQAEAVARTARDCEGARRLGSAAAVRAGVAREHRQLHRRSVSVCVRVRACGCVRACVLACACVRV